jgi:hypothetical protein
MRFQPIPLCARTYQTFPITGDEPVFNIDQERMKTGYHGIPINSKGNRNDG